MKTTLRFCSGVVLFIGSLLIGRADLVQAQCPSCTTACGPISGTDAYVNSLRYRFCDPAQGNHYAMDVCNGRPCSYCGCDGRQSAWHRAMILGVQFYQYNLGYYPDVCPSTCDGGSPAACNIGTDENCHAGAGNFFAVIGSNGWDFHQIHINHSGTYSFSKSVSNGTVLGHLGATGISNIGSHVHAENRRIGVLEVNWFELYIGYTIQCNSRATTDRTVGYPQMQD